MLPPPNKCNPFFHGCDDARRSELRDLFVDAAAIVLVYFIWYDAKAAAATMIILSLPLSCVCAADVHLFNLIQYNLSMKASHFWTLLRIRKIFKWQEVACVFMSLLFRSILLFSLCIASRLPVQQMVNDSGMQCCVECSRVHLNDLRNKLWNLQKAICTLRCV